ncbi:hypothetical protein N8V75_18440, partial [Enterobacter hormaechei subsp. steigerwaltii]|nr:hypothetical protein [Enterobacter hormaechei subsp. steigerwaltii]
MSEKHPGPLVVEGKLSDAERMKVESNYLRGTIAEDLNDGLTGGFKGDNFLLIRFHGMYQQDDRDIRAERAEQGTVAKLAMRQPFVLFKGLTFQKLCLPGAFRPGDHHNKMLRPG